MAERGHLTHLTLNVYWLLVNGYWLMVTGYWLLVNGYWLLVIGSCSCTATVPAN